MASSELAVVGLTCNLVGVFFLANSIIFRRPRKVIEEFFGVGVGALATIRDYALNKIQVIIGFLFLNAGFLLQAFAHLDLLADRWATVMISLAIVFSAVAVYLIGAVYSRRSFKRYLREFFQNHAWSFTDNMAVTKEIGLFLGIRHTQDMTVEDYVRKVRQALGVTTPPKPLPSAGVAQGADRGRRVRDISAQAGR